MIQIDLEDEIKIKTFWLKNLKFETVIDDIKESEIYQTFWLILNLPVMYHLKILSKSKHKNPLR